MKTLKSKIELILKEKPETRDSDITLTIEVWKNFYSSYIKDGKIKIDDLYELPREDHVKRIRAKIQNVENKYLPNKIEIVRKRKINEKLWREFIGVKQQKLFNFYSPIK